MIIQIIDQITNKPKAIIHDFFNLQGIKRLNSEGNLSFGVSYDAYELLQQEIKNKDGIIILYPTGYNQSKVIFSGYILSITPSNEGISFVAKDWIEYTKHRIFRHKKTYSTGTTITNIVADMYSYINTIHPLPFVLRVNDCTHTIPQTTIIEAKTTYYDAMQTILQLQPDLEWRIIHQDGIDLCDISLHSGVIREGIRESRKNGNNNNIVKRSWTSHPTLTMTINDKGIITEGSVVGLPYEQYVTEGTGSIEGDLKLPKISIDPTNEEWLSIELGDRKKTKIINNASWLTIEYVSIIQGIRYQSSATGVSVEFEIGDKLGEQKNVLDKTLAYFSSSINYLLKKANI